MRAGSKAEEQAPIIVSSEVSNTVSCTQLQQGSGNLSCICSLSKTVQLSYTSEGWP